MSFEVWPTTPDPLFALPLEDEYETLISSYEAVNEVAQMNRRFPKHNFMIGYEIISKANWAIIHNFHTARLGRYEPFWFYDPILRAWTDIYVGRGDGSTTTFDLHSKDTVNDATLKVYVNAALKTKITHYNFVSGGGGGSSDRITFTAGNIPTLGALITSDFQGYLRIKGRKDDLFKDKFHTIEYGDIEVFKIREVQW